MGSPERISGINIEVWFFFSSTWSWLSIKAHVSCMVLAQPLLRSQAIRLLDIMRQLQLMMDPRLMLLNLICSGLRIRLMGLQHHGESVCYVC